MATERSASAFRAALAGMFAMALAMGIGRFIYTPILPNMIDAGALDPAWAGMVAGANYLGYMLGALGASASFFVPKRRLWLVIALLASVATTAAMAWSGSPMSMVWLRFMSGLASAFAMIFISMIVMSRLAIERKPGLIALHFAGVGLGILGSALLVSTMVAEGAGWRSLWIGGGVTAAIALALVLLILPPRMCDVAPPPPVEGETVGPRLPLALFVISYGLFGFGYVITATFINTMAKANPALASVEPWVWVVVGLAGLPSVWLWNKLVRPMGAIATYAIACLVEAVGVGLSVAVLSPAVLIVSAAMLGGTFIAITAIGLAQARLMAPRDPSRVIAIMTASFGAGQMIGPVAAGWLFDQLGSLVVASWIAAICLVMAAALAMLSSAAMRN